MFDNFAGVNEKIFWKSTLDCVGQVRSSLGACLTDFFAARVDGDVRMLANIRSGVVRRQRSAELKSLKANDEFRAMNDVQNAQRQNDDRALSS